MVNLKTEKIVIKATKRPYPFKIEKYPSINRTKIPNTIEVFLPILSKKQPAAHSST